MLLGLSRARGFMYRHDPQVKPPIIAPESAHVPPEGRFIEVGGNNIAGDMAFIRSEVAGNFYNGKLYCDARWTAVYPRRL